MKTIAFTDSEKGHLPDSYAIAQPFDKNNAIFWARGSRLSKIYFHCFASLQGPRKRIDGTFDTAPVL